MFDEFLQCTTDKDELETVTIVCDDCVMRITLGELRKYELHNFVIEDFAQRILSDEALEV